MRKKRNDFDAVGAERMTDTELSKKLGSYQRTESIGILLGVILVITGCIMTFVYRNIIVICILVFAGDYQNNAQQYADALRSLIASQLF